MGVINPFSNAAGAEESQTAGAVVSTVRLDVLLRALRYGKRFFDTFLSIPASEYRNLGNSQWSGLIYATVVLYRLNVGLATVPEWDVHVARASTDLDGYLDTLIARLKAVNPAWDDEAGGRHRQADLFSLMPLIFDNVRAKHDRLRRLPRALSAGDRSQVHPTNFAPSPASSSSLSSSSSSTGPSSTRTSTPSFPHPCPAYQFWKKPAGPGSSSSSSSSTPGFFDSDLLSSLGGGSSYLGFEFSGNPFAKVGDLVGHGEDAMMMMEPVGEFGY